MCPGNLPTHRKLTFVERMKADSLAAEDSQMPLDNGLESSSGPIGEPSLSESLGGRLVRHHQGRSTISASLFNLIEDVPGTFFALNRGDLEGFTVMLSCVLTNTQYAVLIQTLETIPSIRGRPVLVDVRFEPTTQNSVPLDTAPST